MVPTNFGALMMADDPSTKGPKPTSKLVGRDQGLYGSAGQEDFALIMVINFAFSHGLYNGSTLRASPMQCGCDALSILGSNHAFNRVREMPIVGGTGVFRSARGTVTAKTYWYNSTSRDAIVKYKVTVFHY
ncbi:Plant disease resistance response protein [Macleaya cordata]|uniref:Dirigent protein n=1 Tax=Macleaya cordata TaxID=56857 RepID=A0A200RAE9_MACCD|nr:Plant disease resistance response protein [Macleaya cordata]